MRLLLRIMRRYFDTGGYVILDYDFYVLKGLLQLNNKRGFFCAVINKRRYWLYVVPSKEM